jgi:hypothetical protein
LQVFKRLTQILPTCRTKKTAPPRVAPRAIRASAIGHAGVLQVKCRGRAVIVG